jgi:hypothetical protein
MTRTCLLVVAVALLAAPGPVHAVTLEWTRQLGSPDYESGTAVTADGLGSVYISGHTGGSLGGANAGGWDAFVSKYDAAGSLLWTRQLGLSTSPD